jgi:hypothetical protein
MARGSAMEKFELYQPRPDNLIRIHVESDGKKLEVLADYKSEDHFSVRLTNSEANSLASKLETPHDVNWIRLENKQVLRISKSGDARQLILSDIKDSKEVQSGKIGVVLEEVLDKVIDTLRTQYVNSTCKCNFELGH